MDAITTAIKDCAFGEGFDLVGIASSDVSHTTEPLDRWLEAGMHGEMAYMKETRDQRSDPGHLLPGCRSVVAVAMSYRTSRSDSFSFSNNDGRVWVSRYAWGRDYHRILKKRLIRLGRRLVELRPSASWRACVDTAPILEREWAARAGLGWIGKNTLLLNRLFGSELFLGVLLTDVELVPDTRLTDHCGKCTACLDACPTEAFPEPRVLDARRCVGYLTVEHRSGIPKEFSEGIGANIAGCDICQEVCPWTRRAPTGLHPEFEPHPSRFRPALAELEAMTEDQFRLWRQGSPLNRISYAQFRRNLRVARGNAGNSK